MPTHFHPPRPLVRVATRAFTLACTLAACAAGTSSAGTITDPSTPSTGQEPSASGGVVTGTVVDTRGNPLAGVQVIAGSTLFYNTNAIGVTDARGRYAINVGQPAGTWHMSAQLTRQFEGVSYTLPLQPENDAPFAGNAGAVRNFSWRLAGARADGLGYFGGTVEFNIDAQGWAANAHQQDIEFTFTPVGPLIDGSTGQTLTLRANQGLYTIRDVPLGKYAITARDVPADGTPRRMVVRPYGRGSYADTLTVTWPVRNGTQYPDRIDLQVTGPDR